jgi:hypothetical protein
MPPPLPGTDIIPFDLSHALLPHIDHRVLVALGPALPLMRRVSRKRCQWRSPEPASTPPCVARAVAHPPSSAEEQASRC